MPEIRQIGRAAVLALGAGACVQPVTLDLPPAPELTDWHREQRRSRRQRIPEDKILNLITIPEPTYCPLHVQDMIPDIVPFGHERVSIDDDYLVGLRAVFPFANDFVLEGCVPMEQTHARVKYCPACRAAKAAWMKPRLGADR
jgi:hypothetical protein